MQTLQFSCQRDQDSQRNALQTIASKQLTSTLYNNRTFDWAALAEYNGGSGLYLTELGGAGPPPEGNSE